ncbi:MAG TPA: tetratricopeptide repeat protein [Myxococcota bacterium]|nr:tetratricopeptide repeat protein [Myxococcota bacterium]HRY92387.1 tetratricopeptide repeat protein [Myxococcota bacterium]
MKGACSRAWVRGAWAAALLGTGLLPACASQKDTMQSEIQYDLGVNDLQAGQVHQALKEFQEAIELNEEFYQAHNGLGLTHHFLGNEQKAIECFQRALELNPDFSSARANLGRVFISQGRFREALPMLEKALEDVFLPERFVAEANLGWALFQIGQEDEGMRRVMSSLAQNESFCVAYEYLGLMHQKRRSFPEAIEHLKQLVKLCPEYVQGYLHLAKVHLLSGDNPHGCTYLENCIQKGRMSLPAQECQRLQRLSCGARPGPAAQ